MSARRPDDQQSSPPPGGAVDDLWEGRESGPVPTPRERFHTGTTGKLRRGDLDLAVVEPLPLSPSALLNVTLELQRRLRGESDEGRLVEVFLDVARSTLPGRHVRVQTVGQRTGEASGENVTISEDALARFGLCPEVAEAAGVPVVSAYMPQADVTAAGFDVPLSDGAQLLGVLSVEYEGDAVPPEHDAEHLAQLAMHLGSALANARVLREDATLRDYLGKLLDHANVPILIIGRRREIRVASRALLELLGRPREAVVGRDFLEFVPEAERGRLLPAFVSALRGRSLSNFEVRLPRANGGHARIAISLASVLGSGGDVEGVIAVGRDLTEVRELEEQVIQAEKLATLGQLAAGVVHELNNPLTSISVYAEYLLKKARAAGTAPHDLEKLERIVEAADRILRFTRDLVVYARPASEDPRLLPVHEVVDQAVVFCEHVVTEYDVTIEKSYAEAPPPVYGVRGQLHQVFINLITNACHAMAGSGGGRLQLRTEATQEHVSIHVADEGEGIPPERVAEIFEPFVSTKAEGEGTGLGLSIVRNIVHQHGGTIDVVSVSGQGAEFIIRLPTRPDARIRAPLSARL